MCITFVGPASKTLTLSCVDAGYLRRDSEYLLERDGRKKHTASELTVVSQSVSFADLTCQLIAFVSAVLVNPGLARKSHGTL